MTDSKSSSVGDAGGEQDGESKQKAISMLQQDWIGFDLDHTLVRYKVRVPLLASVQSWPRIP
jgi:hypothetical protein